MNPLLYQSFIDGFESFVDSNDNLSEVKKFLYLKGFLKGTHDNRRSDYNNANYEEAMKLLKGRFGDKKLLVAIFFDSLLKLNPVKDNKDVAKLQELYNKINTNVRNLKSLGTTSESFGPVLIPVILTKIPENLRLDLILRKTHTRVIGILNK